MYERPMCSSMKEASGQRCAEMRSRRLKPRSCSGAREPDGRSPQNSEPVYDARIDYSALAEQIAERLAQQYPQLTPRERTVCGYPLAGYTAEGISLILGIGMSTIVTYRRRAYSRLGVSNVNQLIAPLLGQSSD